MGSIKSTTGLASGIDIAALVKALLVNNQNAITKLQGRLKDVQTSQTGLTQIQANLLSLTASSQKLSSKAAFQALKVDNSDPSQLSVSTSALASPGAYEFQAVQLATNHRSISRGFANADSQPLGISGELVIGAGGSLSRPVALDMLNDGAGVRRGTIRITDRSGASATIDLKNALTIDDVVQAVNNQSAISVRASTQGGRLMLQDTTGQSSADLSVVDVNGGHAAEDLGIAGSSSTSTLAGGEVFRISSDIPLSALNDGNGLRLRPNASDLSISLRDGSTLEIDLDNAFTVGDVVKKINEDPANSGKVNAALVNGRLTLTDATGGSGALSVSSPAGSNAARVLGLDASASGNVLTGKALSGGLNSALLRNLRGGQGISSLGQVSLTDRTGATAVVDLSQAETLDDVLAAINSAVSSGNVKLQLRAALDARGTGIVITDTSGQSASHLVIADVGGGTTASDLKIAVDGAVNSVASGALGLQSVSEATSLSKYGPNGAAVPSGSFSITNSAGATAIINVTSAVKTIGDVIDRINAAGINVTARLNDTGDGFVLVDDSGGSGTLKVQDIGGAPAAALRLTGAATTGSDGKQRINSRLAAVVQISATDTLMSVSAKINSAGGSVKASVVDSGAAVNPFRLSLTSTIAGRAGRLIVDDGNLGLNFTDQSIGQDAVLRIGSDPATAFLKTSSTNSFQDAVTGYNVTLLKPGTEPAVATGSLNTDSLQSTLTTFVTNYNSMVDQIATLTKYDATTQTRGPLQGNATVLQIPSRILSLVNRIVGTTDAPIRSLADVGLTVIAGGKLRFDPSRFQQAISDHPQDVTQLFLDKDTGFGVKLDALLKDLTDDHTGSLTVAVKAFDDTASQIQDQIDRATSTMNARQAYLENQFNNMEAILSTLQSQQTTLTALSSLITGASTARSSK